MHSSRQPDGLGRKLSSSRRRIVVIGLGVMGRRHLRALQRLPHRFELVGGYDLDSQLGRSACAELGVQFFPSLAEALDAAEAVVIAASTEAHVELALLACQARRHLLVEKPLASAFESARAIVHAAEAAGVHLAIGFTERWNPVVRWLAAELQKEDLWALHIERLGPRPSGRSGAHILWDLAIHDLDLCGYLSRSELVQAQVKGADLSSCLKITARTAQGANVTIDQSWLVPKSRRRITAQAARSVWCGDLLTGEVKRRSRGERTQSVRIVGMEPLLAQAEAFANLLEGRPSHCVRGRDSLVSHAWLAECGRMAVAPAC